MPGTTWAPLWVTFWPSRYGWTSPGPESDAKWAEKCMAWCTKYIIEVLHIFQAIVAQWPRMVTEIWVNIDSGNVLLPDGTKPLPEPVLTYRQWDPVAFLSLGAISQAAIPQPRISEIRLGMSYIKKNHAMMTSSNGNILSVTGHLCGEFTSHRWISRTEASDAELWCFLWSEPE